VNERPGKLYVVPTPGALVRDPVTFRPLPSEGAWVPTSTYWTRRLRAGDVALAEPPGTRRLRGGSEEA
jgi:hypothetical protein